MKTTKTYIAIVTLLMAFSGGIAQNLEGQGNSNSDYLIERDATLQNTEAVSQNVRNMEVPANNPNRLVAAELINYQAVARDAGGVLMTNVPVTIDFEIRNGAGGTAVYNETQNLNTDANGVFSAQIGSVTSLAGVNWLEIDAWLQVDMNGTNVGETQMGSVPTALHSKNSGAVMIYGSGTNNADKMIAQHSPAYPGWGIGYNDVGDGIDFIAGGTKTARITLGSGNISTNGNVEVLQTTSSPVINRVYGNSMPIAYASVGETGVINTSYGVASVTHTGTGVYSVVLDLATDSANTIVNITPFTGSIGIPEICGYNPTGANTFTINIQTAGGAARNSAFTFVVYGNH